MQKGEFGVVGLGRMGGGLAVQALQKGYRVAGFDVAGADDELRELGLVEADGLESLLDKLTSPRVLFLYIHAGPALDPVLDELAAHTSPEDILVDGGNSYWGDSIRRGRRLEGKVRFVDLGTSGGIDGARTGACFMAGGETEALDLVEPILKDLCVPGGYVRAGGPGAGHYVKLVHNGIEFGMLQAIGEGMGLLTNFDQKLDLAPILDCWCHGSVIRSWLVELMAQALHERGTMEQVPPYIEDTGEVNWLVEDAMRMEVPIPVIAQSVMQLFASRDSDQTWARAIALMRHGFGGHPLGADKGIQRDRLLGRVGDVFRPLAQSVEHDTSKKE